MPPRWALSRALLIWPLVLADTLAAQSRSADEQGASWQPTGKWKRSVAAVTGDFGCPCGTVKRWTPWDARVKEMILKGGRARPSVQYDAVL
jgi:hypothetical protein